MLSKTISSNSIILIDDPTITGITIRNENFAAKSLFIPKKIDVAIVDPLLEIPGKIARA